MKLPIVYCSNNVETPIGFSEEFPGRTGVLLTPGNWKDPGTVPYVLDNGRFGLRENPDKWDENKFWKFLQLASKYGKTPEWLVVPDVVFNPKKTLIEWEKWHPIIREKYGWHLALAVQDGMTTDDVEKLLPSPDIIFVGGSIEWKWRTAANWCKKFPRVHIGRVSTEKRLWDVQNVGGESSDSNVWRPIGNHLQILRKYLQESSTRKVVSGFSKSEEVEIPTMPDKVVKDQVITKKYALYCGDCCKVMPQLPDESVGFSIFSPPFASLYSYSDDMADMGNCKDYKEFFLHFKFLTEQLHRVLLPGRIVAVHCMDLPTFKSSGEEIGVRDFPGDIIRCFEECGFIYHSRHCIWKDPLIAATRTKAIGLAHKQIVKDSVLTRTGIPDYILAFRKKGENPVPIRHPQGLRTYHGSRSIPQEFDRYINPLTNGEWVLPKADKRSHWIWQQYASPVWFDIRQTNTLPYRMAREKDDEKHICPLQLDTIERCMELWSTKGDTVLTPFLGVGSEAYVAVKNGRKAIGVELKKSYFRQAVRNVEQADKARQEKRITDK